MTKKLTMAAWTAIFLGSVAVAETPPADTADATIEEETVIEAEAPTVITSESYGDTMEASVETDTDSAAESAPVAGDDSAGGEMTEADEATIDAPEAD